MPPALWAWGRAGDADGASEAKAMKKPRRNVGAVSIAGGSMRYASATDGALLPQAA
jgi:hypothetical protein